MAGQSRHSYEFGPFRLIPTERQLLRDNDRVSLTPKCFDLLVVLVENSGHLIEKGELLKRIWPDSYVEEANLSVNMSALRRALGEEPSETQYIETVPRRGYRFLAPVREHWDDAASISHQPHEGSDATQANEEMQNPIAAPALDFRHRWIRRWPVVLAVLLAFSGLFLVFNVGGLRERFKDKTNPVLIQSLAVLPLENLSGDPAQDYFADGMTEALITDLAKISAIRVMSRSSVMPYKSARKPVNEIGRALNVDAVLTGSVVRVGEHVRITVQLVQAASDQNLWANSYERDLRDVLALQRDQFEACRASANRRHACG
jgi:TolB-like protein/DNA-binding winged helix-turn-helix (wHTH) protein